MKSMDNTSSKYETYKAMKSNLSKAMKDGFYYQAIFIEYAIIEDRCESVLRHAGVKTTLKNKDGTEQEIKLDTKLNKMETHSAFTNPYVRKRITQELVSELRTWKTDRNKLVHDLAKIPYNHDSIKEIAERGQDLARILDNKVKSVNRYYDKLKAEE